MTQETKEGVTFVRPVYQEGYAVDNKTGERIETTVKEGKPVPEGYEWKKAEEDETLTVEITNQQGELVSIYPFDKSKFNIDDAVRAISNLCRYGGRTKKFYSVAEHCVLMTEACIRENGIDDPARHSLAKLVLTHDLVEAYVGDLPVPIKEVCYDFCVLESYVDEMLRGQLNLKDFYSMMFNMIQEYDKRILINEFEQCFNGVNTEVIQRLVKAHKRPLPDTTIRFLSPDEAYSRYMELYNQLFGE